MSFELNQPAQNSSPKNRFAFYPTLLSFPSSSIPLVILVGLPGSGKSTVAAKLVQSNIRFHLISTDAIRSNLFGDESIQGSWTRVWQEVGTQFRQAAANIAAGTYQAAIYDATNVVRKQRRQAIALARAAGFTHITALWLNTPLWICLERNQKRDRQVPLTVILDMQRHLTGAPPGLDEGLDRLVEVRGKWQERI